MKYSIPLYLQLYNSLLEKIESGCYIPGQMLDSERAMASEYSVNRETVKKALTLLEKDGYIERIQGKGTFVSKRNTESISFDNQFINKLANSGITAKLKNTGYKSSSKIITKGVTSDLKLASKKLRIHLHDYIFILHRIRYADDVPLSVEYVYSPMSIMDDDILTTDFENVSFHVRKGEIFGVAGLVGAGRTELFSCIYGLTKRQSGSLYLNGKEVVMKSPVDAIANGIGLVPEERRKQGMFALLSIYENVMMPSYHTISSKGVINFGEAKKRTNRQIDAMRIKTPSCNTQIKNLSGGNQQKVILGRWMEKNVDILILDEPTRGIDVRAKGEIYRLIREMADDGVTVIVISSEMDELISVSDRIMVMHEGLVKGFMEPSEDMVGEEILKVALK